LALCVIASNIAMCLLRFTDQFYTGFWLSLLLDTWDHLLWSKRNGSFCYQATQLTNKKNFSLSSIEETKYLANVSFLNKLWVTLDFLTNKMAGIYWISNSCQRFMNYVS
jgi:hypothetical protein